MATVPNELVDKYYYLGKGINYPFKQLVTTEEAALNFVVYKDKEVVGEGDGATVIFQLDEFPYTATSLRLFVDGIQTTDFSANPYTGAILMNSAPAVGAVLTADYSRTNVQKVSLSSKVNASLMLLFDTGVGERFMLPAYGCRLRELIFMEIGAAFEALAAEFITTAIYTWEKRVKTILNISFEYNEDNPHFVLIHVEYELITGQVVDNFVYPFLTT